MNTLELLLHAVGDVEVVAQLPWWTLPRLLVAVAVLTIGLTLAGEWFEIMIQGNGVGFDLKRHPRRMDWPISKSGCAN
jgi:hypothetical protein